MVVTDGGLFKKAPNYYCHRSQWSGDSMLDCDVRNPAIQSQCSWLSLVWQLLWHAAFSIGCTPRR